MGMLQLLVLRLAQLPIDDCMLPPIKKNISTLCEGLDQEKSSLTLLVKAKLLQFSVNLC